MLKRFLFALAACVPLFAGSATAQNEMAVDQLLDRMESVRKSVQTFKADVVKLRQVEVLGETERYVGALQFQSPRLLRLELKSAETNKETFYIVGSEFGWIYRPQDRQAERARMRDLKDQSKSGNPLEYGLASSIHGLKEGYVLRLLPEEKVGAYDTIPLELNPTKDNVNANGKILFWIDKATWLPVQIREYKSNDEIIETHTFAAMQINPRVSKDTFDFKPPEGVDVIVHE